MVDILNSAKLSPTNGELSIISFPTETHREFIEFITQKSRELSLTALLKGSLVKGTAKKYSDIDLALMGTNISNRFDEIVETYNEVLLSENFTSSSTYMVIYANGLAVEYDIRKTITMEDISKSYILNVGDYTISDICRDRLSLASHACPIRDPDYSQLMIAQMCCAKLLCNKENQSREIYYDRMSQVGKAYENRTNIELSTVHTESRELFIKRIKKIVDTSPVCSPQMLDYFGRLFSCF